MKISRDEKVRFSSTIAINSIITAQISLWER